MTGTALVVCIAAGLILGASIATAATTHPFVKYVVEGNSSGLEVKLVATDEETGNVFGSQRDLNAPAERIKIVGSEGEAPAGVAGSIEPSSFSPFGSLAVDNVATSPNQGSLYVTERGNKVRRFVLNPVSEKYESGGVLSENTGNYTPRGVAIDRNGHVFVSFTFTPVAGETFASLVEFDTSGVQLRRIDFGQSLEILGSLAFDSAGDLFVESKVDHGAVGGSHQDGSVYKFTANGLGEIESSTQPTLFFNGELTGIATDPSTNSLYIVERVEYDPNVSDGSVYAVSEYDIASGKRKGGFGRGILKEPVRIAVNSKSGNVYVADIDKGVALFGPTVELPEAITGSATAITTSGATLNGSVNPKGLELQECFFEYGRTNKYGHSVPCVETPGEIGSGEATKPVHAAVSGLQSGQLMHFRLVTKVSQGLSEGEDATFILLGPGVSGTTATAIADTHAELLGKVNPHGVATSYHFQYLTLAEFEANGFNGAQEAPLGGKDAGAGGSDVAVNQTITGLQPITTYVYRLVAANAQGVTEGETNEAGEPVIHEFSTFFTAFDGLPDGRVYEQVTPVKKNGNNAGGWKFLLKAAPDGGAMGYFISSGGEGGEGGEGSQDLSTYEAARDATGWRSRGMLPPSSLGDNASIIAWSKDVSRNYALVWNSGADVTLYLRDNAAATEEPIASGLGLGSTAVAAEAGDSAQVLFESMTKLLPEAVEGVSNVYLWERATGALSLVSVLPDETTAPAGAFAGPYFWVDDDPDQGGAKATHYTQDMQVLSSDGSRAFFTTTGEAQLYVRKDPAGPGATTARVSASQKTNGAGPGGTDPNGPKPAAFMQATPDGRYVFFASQEELTDDATTGSADQGKDLYRYDTTSGALIDLAPDTLDAKGAEVQGVLGASDDGSHVYFVAQGVLAAGASPGTVATTNLYLWNEGAISFIARLSRGQEQGGRNWLPVNYNGGVKDPRASRVTPDGQTLIFLAENSPTAYDSEGKNEFYRYRVGSGLDCVSCNPNGLAPTGPASLQNIGGQVFLKPVLPLVPWLLNNLSADGNRAFFESPDRLVTTDTNGVLDVYEWEAEGTGSCHADGQNNGCLYLISTGTSPEPSFFADASASGDDVFFFTTSSLVGQDTDTLRDVYDARVGGGLPAQNPPPPNPCSGEACRGPGSSPPPVASPGSSTFSGPGNPKAQHKKKHHKKKHKKHHHKKKTGKRQQGRAGR